jgi:hypothetical protein
MGFYYNETQHTSHKITHHTQTNTAHKTTRTIKDTLHNNETNFDLTKPSLGELRSDFKQEVLGRTNRLLSFDTTRTA